MVGDLVFFTTLYDRNGARELRIASATPPAARSTNAAASGGTSSTAGGGSTTNAATGVTVTWADNSNNESGFLIDRSTRTDFLTIDQTVFVAADTTSYLDTAAAPGTTYYYRVTAVNAGGSSAPAYSPAPPLTVVSASFDDTTAAHRLVVRFSASVAATLQTSDLLLQNTTTGETVPASAMQLVYDPATDTATSTFPGLPNGRLTDGAWRATLASADVSDPIGRHLTNTSGGGSPDEGWRFGFVRLAADANRDGRVDVLDLGVLAQNYGRTTRRGPERRGFQLRRPR